MKKRVRHATSLALSLFMAGNYLFTFSIFFTANAEGLTVEEPTATEEEQLAVETPTATTTVEKTPTGPKFEVTDPAVDEDVLYIPFDVEETADDSKGFSEVVVEFYQQHPEGSVPVATKHFTSYDPVSKVWKGQVTELPSVNDDKFKVVYTGYDDDDKKIGQEVRTNIIINGTTPEKPPVVTVDAPVQTGYNINDGTSPDEPRDPNQFACTGGVTNVNGVSIHWTDVAGGDPDIMYLRQYSRDGVAWSGAEYYTNPFTNYRTFGYGEVKHFSRVLAFNDANNNGSLDAGEEASAWSNICSITYDATPPVVEITSHHDGDVVSGTIEIHGSVTDANPHHYWISFPGYSQVVNDTNSFTNQLLATWDTTFVADGTYLIKLEARDAAGNKDPQCGGSGQPVCSGDSGVSVDWVEVIIDNSPTASIDEEYIRMNPEGYACGLGNAWSDDGLKVNITNWDASYRLQGHYYAGLSTPPAGTPPYNGWFDLTEGLWGSGHFDFTDPDNPVYTLMNTGNSTAGYAGWQVRIVNATGAPVSEPDNVDYLITTDPDSATCNGNMALGYETVDNYQTPDLGLCDVFTNDLSRNGGHSALQVLEWNKVDYATKYRLSGYSWNGAQWAQQYSGYVLPDELPGNPEIGYNDPDPQNGNVIKYTTYATNQGTYTYFVEALDNSGNVLSNTWVVSDHRSEFDLACKFAVDRTAPIVAVNPLTTADTTPELTGTVNDPAATILVTVESNMYTATNNGDGTWVLADDTISPALAEGTYDVIAMATDPTGNAGYDATIDELVIDLDPLPPAWLSPVAPVFITHNGDGIYGIGPDVIATMSFNASESPDVTMYQYQFVRRALDGTFLQQGMVNLPVSGGPYGFHCDNSVDPVVCTWEPNMQDNNQWIFRLRAVDSTGNRSVWTNWNNIADTSFADTSFTYNEYMERTGVFSGANGYVEGVGGYAVRESIDPESSITTPSPMTSEDPMIDIDFTATDNETELKLVILWGYKVSPTLGVTEEPDVTKAADSMTWSGTFEDVAFWDGYGTYCFFTTAEDIADDGSMDFFMGNMEDDPEPSCELEVTFQPSSFIQGKKRNDLNGNGILERGEPPMENWSIYLYDSDWNRIAETLTDENDGNGDGLTWGQYRFENLEEGRYYVCEEAREGWKETRPASVLFQGPKNGVADYCFRVNITAPGQAKTGYQFGNADTTTPTIDTIPNQEFDEGETVNLGILDGKAMRDTGGNLDMAYLEVSYTDMFGGNNDSMSFSFDVSDAGCGFAGCGKGGTLNELYEYYTGNPIDFSTINVVVDTALLPEGVYMFDYYVTDKAGNRSDCDISTPEPDNCRFSVTINNVAPEVFFDANQTVDEGEPAVFSGLFTDPSTNHLGASVPLSIPEITNFVDVTAANTGLVQAIVHDDQAWYASIDYGDGTVTELGTFSNPGTIAIPDHAYLVTYSRNFVATLTVCEALQTVPYDPMYSENACTPKTVTVTVNNVVPTVTVTPGAPQITTAQSVTLTATGSGGNAPLTYSWTCANGQSGIGTTLVFQNATTGTFTCTVTVADKDGDTASAQSVITVGAVQGAVTEPGDRNADNDDGDGTGGPTEQTTPEETENNEGEVEGETTEGEQGSISGETTEESEKVCFWWWLLGIVAFIINAGFVALSREKLEEEKWRFAVPVLVAVAAFLLDKLMHTWWTPSEFCRWMWAIALFAVIVPAAVWFLIRPKKN